MSASSPRRVIVLGALSAIAEATARVHAREGDRLLLAARNAERLRQAAADLTARGAECQVRALDLATHADIRSAFAEMADALGGVDVVYIAYGFLGDQKRAETDPEEARAILNINFLSAAEWALAAADRLRRQGAGTLIAIGSVAGDRGRQSNYVYGAAKGGLSLLLQGIAHSLAGTGARAVIARLGFVDTPMTADLKKGGPLWASPERIAAALYKASYKGGPVVYAPWFWRWIMLVIRLVPAPVFHKTRL